MNQKESTAIDISNLLVTNQVEIRGPNNTIRLRDMTVLEHLRQRIQSGDTPMRIPQEVEKEEKEKLVFRFNDFNLDAQLKFCKMLKKDSSIWTIKRIPVNDSRYKNIDNTQIWETLKILNPIIASNYYSGFCMGSFNRWKERCLSHLVYHANKKYRTPNQEEYLIKRAIDRY